jgi:hypothetical protein
VLGTFTANAHGGLTTQSTYLNMPTTALSPVSTMSISPSGKLLAAGGQGFQVFHFNGSRPITDYTGLLQAGDSFEEFGWDRDNHLFASSGNALFVYTATPTSIKQTGLALLYPASIERDRFQQVGGADNVDDETK